MRTLEPPTFSSPNPQVLFLVGFWDVLPISPSQTGLGKTNASAKLECIVFQCLPVSAGQGVPPVSDQNDLYCGSADPWQLQKAGRGNIWKIERLGGVEESTGGRVMGGWEEDELQREEKGGLMPVIRNFTTIQFDLQKCLAGDLEEWNT